MAATTVLGCGASICGSEPRGFGITDAFWDENRERPEADELQAQCEQFKPVQSRFLDNGWRLTLPEINLDTKTLAGGGVALSDKQLVAYQTLQGIDLAMVQEHMGRCQAAATNYACVTYNDPEKDPRISEVKRFFDSLSLALKVSDTAKAEANATTQAERDALAIRIKGLLDEAVKTLEDGDGAPDKLEPGLSGAMSPLSRQYVSVAMSVQQHRLTVNQYQLTLHQTSQHGLEQEIQRLNQHVTSLSTGIEPVVNEFPAVLNQLHLTSNCIKDQRLVLDAVRLKRQELTSALGSLARVEPDVYRQLEVEFTAPGFGSCGSDVLNAAASLRDALDQLAARITPSTQDVTVYGYADERPLRSCARLRDNMQLAEQRATSVASYLALRWELPSEPKSYGRVFPLAKAGCLQVADPQEADLCHEHNRRIRLQISSDGYQFRLPESCQRKQLAVTPG
jgi:flagellar motor protein MotB